jgi:hypothetical protein
MGYETTRMTKASHGRMLLVNAAAFLFMVAFFAHSVIAGGMMSHSPVPSNHAYVLSEARHGSAACDVTPLQSVAKACAALAHDHGDGSGTPPCCGDVCHLALAPHEVLSPQRIGHEESIVLVSVPLLSGRVLEGPRRPPRLLV